MTMNLISTILILFPSGEKGPQKPLHDVGISQVRFMVNFELMNLFHITLPNSLNQLYSSFLLPTLQRRHSVSFHSKLQSILQHLPVELSKYCIWENQREYHKHFLLQIHLRHVYGTSTMCQTWSPKDTNCSFVLQETQRFTSL